MSARTGRKPEDLFVPSGRSIASGRVSESKHQEEKQQQPQRDESKNDYADDETTDDLDRSPLQLEHMIGFGAEYSNSVIMLPDSDSRYVKCMDSLVAIENLNDPSEQKILRGHDMQVTTLAVSPSGQYVASGQIGTKNFKGFAAPVFVWDTLTKKRLVILRGLSQRVNILAFSTDERLVCGCGEDSLLYIWELSTGEVIFGKQFPTPVSFLKWVEHKVFNRKVSYELVFGVGAQIFQGSFNFEAERVQWSLSITPYMMPTSGGIVRNSYCACLSPTKEFVYVGSTGAEMLVFGRAVKPVFRCGIPVCTNGVRSIACLSDGDVICGGGDGILRRLHGFDLSWEIVQQVFTVKGNTLRLE